jgi:hypothetical protein
MIYYSVRYQGNEHQAQVSRIVGDKCQRTLLMLWRDSRVDMNAWPGELAADCDLQRITVLW